MTVVLGITGSIATGKSSVVNVFRQHQIPVVDGDLIARKIMEPGQPALRAVVAEFGPEILQADGTLDRKKLGNLIFNDPRQRLLLDRTLEPYLRGAIIGEIKSHRGPLVVADIPLLFEKEYEDAVDQIAVVYVPRNIQLQRLMARDNLTAEEATKKINSQMSIEAKKHQADIVFDNQGTQEETARQVITWLKNNRFN